jgi:long-chain acyl-CoA synthetase
MIRVPTVQSLLEVSADQYPDKIALVCGGIRYSYRQLEEVSNQVAHQLIAVGISRGDRVAVYLDNSFEAVISIFAVLKAGGAFVMIHPDTKQENVLQILNNSQANVLITKPGKEITVQGCTIISRFDKTTPIERPPIRNIDIDLACIIYTSGTTGHPKGVMLTHQNMMSSIHSITSYLKNTSADIILNVLPLSFNYGLYQVLMVCKFCGTLILLNSFAYPAKVLEIMNMEKVTGFPMVPMIIAVLLQMKVDRVKFPHLRYITNAAAPLPVPHLQELKTALPHVEIYCMYGLTECTRASYLLPEEIDTRLGSIGRGIPNVEIYIVDEEGQRLGVGGIGELVVRGSNVMKGYWNAPEETDRVLRPGLLPGEKVLYTGDLFSCDNEGYFYFVRRKDDVIKTRGEKVSPAEVENALCGLHDVLEAGVIGRPDKIQGESICAFVVLRDQSKLREEDLLQYCKDKLIAYMVPSHIYIVKSLPKSPNGKLERRKLREIVI